MTIRSTESLLAESRRASPFKTSARMPGWLRVARHRCSLPPSIKSSWSLMACTGSRTFTRCRFSDRMGLILSGDHSEQRFRMLEKAHRKNGRSGCRTWTMRRLRAPSVATLSAGNHQFTRIMLSRRGSSGFGNGGRKACTKRRTAASSLSGSYGWVLASAITWATGLTSRPQLGRPAFNASTRTVPEPMNGSATTSPWREYSRMSCCASCGMKRIG